LAKHPLYTPSKILARYLGGRVGDKLVYEGDGYFVAEPTKCSHQHLSTFLLFSGIYFAALLDESHAFMQDLPN
jgi:hypothetical protein